MSTLDQRILDAVREIPGISVLLLFGSQARGNPRKNSDLDVAVLPDKDLQDDYDRLKLRSRIAVALSDLVADGRVDVVFLDQAEDLLRQRVMEHGRILLCRDDAAWRKLRVRTMREYGDREWVRDLLRRGLRRRLLEGQFSYGRSARTFESPGRAG